MSGISIPPRFATPQKWRRFLEVEYRSSSLPTQTVFDRFGSVSDLTDQQGLDAPFVVELFTVRFLGGAPEVVLASGSTCRHAEAPYAGRCSTNLTSFAPDWPHTAGIWSLSPIWGISAWLLAPARTHFEQHGLAPRPCGPSGQVCPVRPRSCFALPWDRIWRLHDGRMPHVYFQKPPSNWTSTSRCIQLYSRSA